MQKQQSVGAVLRVLLLAAVFAFNAGTFDAVQAQDSGKQPPQEPTATEPDSITSGTVTVGGAKIAYKAIAGTVTVGSTDTLDALIGADGTWLPQSGVHAAGANPDALPATARIFYVAYFRTDGPAGKPRPVMFLYNGGPSTASLWLHMGAFGPKRIALPNGEKLSGAPYPLVENDSALLDVADLIFIDAPGTGFSRVMGRDAQRAFWGVDQDAHAFERCIRRLLSKYDLWNRPKYLFGESYGTSRTAVLAAALQNVDLSGIVLMSQILTFDNSLDAVKGNPGVDQAYALALPSYAATAWFHHRLSPQPAELEPLLRDVENFAMGPYMTALMKGSELSDVEQRQVAEQLASYTGIPAEMYIRANLRLGLGAFQKALLRDEGKIIGRLDTRFTAFDPTPGLEENDPGLDPVGLATGAPFYSLTTRYLTNELKFGANEQYKYMLYDVPGFRWDWRHQGPGSPAPLFAYTGTSMSLDLAFAMKRNPKMKVLLLGGYYDLGTPFFEGLFEMHHLPIAPVLQNNIAYHYYKTGHMIYLEPGALKQLHADVADFVLSTEDPH